MFKKSSENLCMNTEILQFLSQQFFLLKDIAKKCVQYPLEITAERILQCVILMEKKLQFTMDQKSLEQFHDYITDFYESQLAKNRAELARCSMHLQNYKKKIEDLSSTLETQQEMNQMTQSNNILTYEAETELMEVKKELIHSQTILQQNQGFINEQNGVINELRAYISKLEHREDTNRHNYESKIKKMDQQLNENLQSSRKLMKVFESERKTLERDLKEVELVNVRFLEERDKYEAEITLKSDEILLLTQKIYECNLVSKKLEQEIVYKEHSAKGQIDSIRLLEDQVTGWREKCELISEEWQSKLHEKLVEIKDKQLKIVKLTNENAQIRSSILQADQRFVQKQVQANTLAEKNAKLQQNMQSSEVEHEKLSKEHWKFSKVISSLELDKKDLEQELALKCKDVGQLKRQLKEYKKVHKEDKRKHEIQKIEFKSEIMLEIEDLVEVNEQSLERIKHLEISLSTLEEQKSDLTEKLIKETELSLKYRDSYEEIQNIISKLETQKMDLLTINQEQTRKIQRIGVHQVAYGDLQSNYIAAQEQIEALEAKIEFYLKQIEHKASQIETLENHLKQSAPNQRNSQPQNPEEVRILKQELCKKDFIIKQLSNKVAILQEQLRQNDQQSQMAIARANEKIKELEELLRERFDFSSRVIDPI